MNYVKNSIDGAIETCMAKLEILEAGTEEYEKVSEAISKLHKLRIEEQKMENDRLEKDRKETQVEHEIVLKLLLGLLECGVKIGGTILTLKVFETAFYNGLKFEQDGAFSSSIMRGILPKLKIW